MIYDVFRVKVTLEMRENRQDANRTKFLMKTNTVLTVLLFTKTTKTTKKYRNDYEITGTTHKRVCGKRFLHLLSISCGILCKEIIRILNNYAFTMFTG